ncbi:MAG: phosphatidylcholine/phosphatidylserine synthase [Proteobacteria bacterium]|nr:phosphatidylcholine/phosphatidylserine synthase [Pseudomonadota bacterium]
MIRRPRMRPLPVNSLIPNMLTVVSLCAGLTSIRFSLVGEWEAAVLAIVVAGVMDGLDGRLARLLKGVTRFGAELDSLADFLSFGVAPVILLYEWTLADLGGVGWIVVLCYPVCCALRLARFNTEQEPDRHPGRSAFFVGLPAPAAAAFAILPLAASFQWGWEFFRWPLLVAPFVLAISVLMISRLPTISFKRVRIRREHVLPLLVVLGAVIAALTSYPWLTLVAVTLLYALAIPVALVRHAQTAQWRQTPDSATDAAAPADEDADTVDSRQPGPPASIVH